MRLHWKAKGHVRELFPEKAFQVCSLSELRYGVQYSALTYMCMCMCMHMCATHTITRTVQCRFLPSTAHVGPSLFSQRWKTPWSAVLAELRDTVASPWVWIDVFCLNQTDGPEIARTLSTASTKSTLPRARVPRRWARERLDKSSLCPCVSTRH